MFLQIKPNILWDGDGGGSSGGTDAPPVTPPATPPAGGSDTGQPGPVPYERFKQVNDTLKTLQTELDQLKAAQKAATDKEAADQGKWKELYEQREAELKTERQKASRLKVIADKKLPAELADRLRGETEAEMVEDAELLLTFLKPTDGPGVPPPGGGGKPLTFDLSKMTPDEIRKNADKIQASLK